MRIRKAKDNRAEGDLTPMIDMTFQLIAFFMVLVNFSEAEQDQRVKLPESELAKPPEVPFEEPLTLQMTKKGEVIVHGQPFNMDAMPGRLTHEAMVYRSMDKAPTEITVIIRADEGCPTGKVQELIKHCQDAEFIHFALRAKEKERF